MGVNAQTSVPKFTSGDVLTAANTNLLANGIPVFSGTATRNDAFGGSGEKTLAEGQFAYLEDTNTTQYYDGAAWQPVGVAPGMVLVKSQTIGSAVSSVSVADVFSSTYDNYKILISGGVGSAAANIGLQMGSTATGYYWSGIFRQYTTTTVSADKVENGSSWNYAGRGSTTNINMSVEVFAPNLAKNTQAIMFNSGAQAADYFFMTAGYLADTTQYTGFTLTPNTGTLTGGTIRVYGLANS